MAKPVNEGTWDGASGPTPLKDRLIRDCSVPWVIRSPPRPTNNGDRAGHRDKAEVLSPALRSIPPGNRMARLSRYASMTDRSSASIGTRRSFLAAFASDVDGRSPVIGGANIANVREAELLGA
jgi:hypothetical protein